MCSQLELGRDDYLDGIARGLEVSGVWTGSGSGVDFHCRCGWSTGLSPTVAEARVLLRDLHAAYHAYPGMG